MATQAMQKIDDGEAPRASRLQADLAARILRMLKDQRAGAGHHLVELDLCREFDVSRTPVRGALRLLADQGLVEPRANRGYVLREAISAVPELDMSNPEEEEDRRLFIAIAEARNSGRLPDQCSQQEMLRIFDTKLPTVLRVLRQFADLGLVERKPGNGWSFAHLINSADARSDSYAYRSIIEPAGLLEPTFAIDADWLQRSREQHIAFRKLRWRDTMAVELYAMNSDFHEGLARCSGNRYLLDAVQRQNRLRSFLHIQWVNGVERVEASIDEHLEIMDAVAEGKNSRAHALMKLHLDSARDVEATIR